MERSAKRAVAATAGIIVVASILAVTLYASVQGAASGGSVTPTPNRSGGHVSPAGKAPAVPNIPGVSQGCDHGQHKDQGKCVGHLHHGVGEANQHVRGDAGL